MIYSTNRKVNFHFRALASFLIGLAALAILPLANQSEAKTVARGQATSYVRYATGINIYGSPKDWHTLAERYGYYVSSSPVQGGVVSIERGAYGTDDAYGFIGVVIYYQGDGDYWNVGTRYAPPAAAGADYDRYFSVSERLLRVLKNDPKVHYIYRGGLRARPKGYYSRLEYAGYEVVGKQYAFSPETKEMTVYADEGYARAYVGPGQVVRVLARGEVGETLWVFIETPYRPGNVYAETYYGGKGQLRKFEASSADAYRMYYASNYGDAVLDLGYLDYSKIAGDSGEVTITIKKGADPTRLVLLQTISLQLARN
jgi:hypothetical protein